MKTRITAIEFSKRFNSTRMAYAGTPITLIQLTDLLKEAKVYHSPMFIARLIKENIISKVDGKYMFSLVPTHFKKFEPLLDWEYNRTKKYRETFLSKQIDNELENAIAICKKHGLYVLREI